MINDLQLRFRLDARSKSARGLAHSKTLTRWPNACGISRGFGVRWPSTALAALTLAILGLTTAFAETLLLTGATVHPVSSKPIPNGQVLVRDGKIAAVGKSVTAEGAKTLSLTGLHLYPGLIALNTDLGLLEIGGVRAREIPARWATTRRMFIRGWR
jgi:hypothetical protein